MHDLKRSLQPRVVVVDDLFSYGFTKAQIKQIKKRWVQRVKSLLMNQSLIEYLFQCDRLTGFEWMIKSQQIFDFKPFLEDDYCHVLKIKNTLYQRVQKVKHSGMSKLYQQVILELKRAMLAIILQPIKTPFYLQIDDFEYHLLYQMNVHLKGLVLKHPIMNQQQLDIIRAYDLICVHNQEDIPMITSTKPEPLTRIKTYLPMADLRHLKWVNHPFYDGIYVMSEYMIASKGLMMDETEAFMQFEQLFTAAKNKPIWMTIPTFTEQLPLDSDPTCITDVDTFSMMHPMIQQWLLGLKKAIYAYHPNLMMIIPKMNSQHDLDFWLNEMDMLMAFLEEEVHVGMTVETEGALQFCEDFKFAKGMVFHLDTLMQEYDETHIIKPKSMLLMDDLRMAHFILRAKFKRPHVLCGKVLEQQAVLQKFLNLGFREFIIKPSQICLANDIFQAWEKSRGKYAKKDGLTSNIKKSKRKRQ